MACSQAEVDYCVLSVEKGLRLDGRQATDFRPLEVELSPIAQASGSARLRLGSTDVIVGVKAEVESVSKSQSEVGRLVVTVDCSPCASPEYEGRGGEAWGQQLGAALQASLAPQGTAGQGPASELLRSLVIIPGRAAWTLYVDGLVLNDGGGVLGALSAAAIAALAATRLPKVTVSKSTEEGSGGEPEIELEDDGTEGVPLAGCNQLPVVLSCALLGRKGLVVDPGLVEEKAAKCTLHIAVDYMGRVCGIQQEGKTGVGPADLLALVDMATALGPGLLTALRTYIAQADTAMEA